ncbi:uncharacterized protein DUF1203 [Tenacibaculum adriaticum]|uniref:Uncharacterized protein DUF1203 n=1 Tax=Tenacibaculum adriaticum TaxID=413713 RepID=A0A5S5DWH1_9FLAO|nr:DUF1203 domain-containing protein [Tenacibaculum adriaticum]TYP99122.1 uncharacterized protein DUF1203 [Tenacibaculum adriaticum]
MNVNFRVLAIENHYNHLFNLSEKDLLARSIIKMIVDKKLGFPCRVSLKDVEIGEEVILFPFHHHKTTSPYQASGPIFVRKNAKMANLGINEIPEMLFKRSQSLRGYNENGMMIYATTAEGENIRKEIEIIFSNEEASYIQIHNANPGCYNCQVNRV